MPKDLCIAKRKYTDKDGQEKTQWLNIGVMFEPTAEKSGYILLDAGVNLAAYKPADKNSVIVSIFDKRDSNGNQQQPQQQASAQPAAAPAAQAPFDDEIPF